MTQGVRQRRNRRTVRAWGGQASPWPAGYVASLFHPQQFSPDQQMFAYGQQPSMSGDAGLSGLTSAFGGHPGDPLPPGAYAPSAQQQQDLTSLMQRFKTMVHDPNMWASLQGMPGFQGSFQNIGRASMGGASASQGQGGGLSDMLSMLGGRVAQNRSALGSYGRFDSTPVPPWTGGPSYSSNWNNPIPR